MDEKNQILRMIADNPLLFDALKELVESRFRENRDDDSGYTDERLGQMYRAQITGLREVRAAWKEISNFKTKENVGERVNRAR